MDESTISGLFKIAAATITPIVAYFLNDYRKKRKETKDNSTYSTLKDEITKKTSSNSISRRSDDGVFVGREDEIEELKVLIKKYNLIAIKGHPGIGKTTLVRNLLLDEEVSGKFNNKIYFIELSEQFTSDGICNKLLEKFNKSVSQGDFSPTVQVYQELKEHDDLLIVFDNCEQIKEDIFKETIKYWADSFQSGKNFTFIVTSRKDHRSGKKLVLKSLELPSSIEDYNCETTRALVKKIQIHKPKFKVDKSNKLILYNIAKKTDGVPWLIQIVSGKINYMSLQDIEVSVKGIKSGDRKKFFDRSYNEIDENSRLVFDQIAIFEDGFDITAFTEIVKVGSLNKFELHELLNDLISYSFLYYQEEDKRYKMLVHVKEIGEILLSKWDETKLDNLKKRWIDYYFRLISVESLKLSNHNTHIIDEALDKMRNEKENVFAIQEALVNEKAHDKLAMLSILFDEVLYSRGPATLRINKLRIAYDANESKAGDSVVDLCIALSKAYWSSGYWIKAESFAKKGVDVSINNTVGKARSLQQLGRILKDRGFLVESKRILLSAKEIFAGFSDIPVNQIDDLNAELGNTYDQLGELEKCIETIGSTSNAVKSVSLANKHNRIALAYWHHGRVTESVEHLDVAIQICLDINHKPRAAAYTTNKALVLIDVEDYDNSQKIFIQNFEDHEDSGHRQWLAVNYGGLGRLYLRRNNPALNDLDNGQKQIERALELSIQVGYLENIAWHTGDLGRLHFLKNDYSKGFKYVTKSLSLQKRMGAMNTLRHFSNHITLLRIHEKSKDIVSRNDYLSSLFYCYHIYKINIHGKFRKIEKFLKIDIEFYRDLLKNEFNLELEFLSQAEICKVVGKDNYSLFTTLRENEMIGAYEYHDNETYKWKYWRGDNNSESVVDVFGYGALFIKSIRDQFNPQEVTGPVKAVGIKLLCNHHIIKDYPYFNYHSEDDIGFGIYNIEYTGEVSDFVEGILLKLKVDDLKRLGEFHQGCAIRLITIESEKGPKTAIGLTSTERVFYSRKITKDDISISEEYQNNCSDGAKEFNIKI